MTPDQAKQLIKEVREKYPRPMTVIVRAGFHAEYCILGSIIRRLIEPNVKGFPDATAAAGVLMRHNTGIKDRETAITLCRLITNANDSIDFEAGWRFAHYALCYPQGKEILTPEDILVADYCLGIAGVKNNTPVTVPEEEDIEEDEDDIDEFDHGGESGTNCKKEVCVV